MDHHVHYNVGSQNQSLKKSQIVSVTSLSPIKLTEPRQVCQILFNDELQNQKIDAIRIIEGCYQIVLYYEKVQEEDHDWSLMGWIVESLARALLDYPLLAGRLKKRDMTAGFEIVSNDSGIRLLEAQYSTTLSEFLELKKKECDDHEAEIVFWNEIDGQFPQFSPLFYVQMTNFKCGGYSIVISCSLLLVEVLVDNKFLNKWSQIHMLPSISNEKIDTLISNYPCLKNPKSLTSEDLINHTQNKNRIQSVVFKITTKDVNFSKELWRELAMFCIEEVEQKLDTIISTSFTLVVKESLEVIEVENVTKSGYTLSELGIKNQIICISSWNDFGVNAVVFHEDNKPVHVSCWIRSVTDAHVMIVPCLEENVCFVIVASPR